MKPLALCIVLFCAPTLLAQEKQPVPEQPPQTQEQTQTRATPAPQLGHPLDPADVDVLTGKTKPQQTNAVPYPVDPLSYAYGSYAAYPQGNGAWGTRRYASFGPARTPFLFGRTRRGSFFFGNPGFFAPPLSFFGGGRGSFFFLF